MAEEWELQSLERRIEALEKKNERRSERRDWWLSHVAWTLYVAALTALIVLAAAGVLHHH